MLRLPTPRTADEELLDSSALTTTDSMRIRACGRISEWGFAALADVYHGVTIFGSACTHPDDVTYHHALDVVRIVIEATERRSAQRPG